MSENIKKMKKILLPQGNVENTSSKYSSTDASQIIKYANSAKEDLDFEGLGSLDDVADIALKNVAIDLLHENGFDYSVDDIWEIGEDYFGKLQVRMQNNEKFTFYKDDNGYKLITIRLSDGTQVNCTLSDAEERELSGMIKSHRANDPFRGYAEIDVNGYKTRVYWVNDADTDLSAFQKNLNIIRNGISKIPDQFLDVCMVGNGGEFKGFFIGAHYGEQGNHPGNDFNAYAYNDEFIYVNSTANPWPATIVHELGHIFDYSVNGDHHVSGYNSWINEFYEHYNQALKPLIPANSGYHTTGPTSVHEFFACLFEAYIDSGNDLQQLLPEVYEKLDRWLSTF